MDIFDMDIDESEYKRRLKYIKENFIDVSAEDIVKVYGEENLKKEFKQILEDMIED